MNNIKYGILKVSDRSYNTRIDDKCGTLLEECINDEHSDIGSLLKGRVCVKYIVPNDAKRIKKILKDWTEDGIDVILTIGGTGFSGGDVVPEATMDVIHMSCSGMLMAMLTSTFKNSPMCMLNRAMCGIRGKTLIINLPGSFREARECLSAIASTIPYGINIINNKEGPIRSMNVTFIDETKSATRIIDPQDPIEHVVGPRVDNRTREERYPIISIGKAMHLIMENAAFEREIVESDLEACHNRISFTVVRSKCDLPPFTISTKDGYAVLASDRTATREILTGIRAIDLTGGTVKRMAATASLQRPIDDQITTVQKLYEWASHPSSLPSIEVTNVKLPSGTCVRVNAGAPIPANANAVVPVEDTKFIEGSSDTENSKIEITTRVRLIQNIKYTSDDIEEGQIILNECTKLGALEIGLAAACGCSAVVTAWEPTVGVLSIGDEIQPLCEPLLPGGIYDSNRYMLISMLRDIQYPNIVELGFVSDDKENMVERITQCLQKADVLITSGSVSFSGKDMLKPILIERFNATIHFGRVNMKRGEYTAFATCKFEGRDKCILCLPGNPVSAFITMNVFGIPMLNKIRRYDCEERIVRVKLTSSYKLGSRPEYAAAKLKWSNEDILPTATIVGNEINSTLLNIKNANSLVMLPACGEIDEMQEGDVIDAILL